MDAVIHRVFAATVPRRNRGSVLFYSIVMLTFAGFAVLGLTRLAGNYLKGVRASEQRLKAQYIAEAGINQVTDWFNRGYWTWARTRPEADYLDSYLFPDWTETEFTDEVFQDYFHPDSVTGRFVDLAGDSVITQSFDILSLYPTYVPQVKTPNGKSLGSITTLRVYAPDVSIDPEGTVCWVECSARTPDGTEAWVQMQLTDNQLAYVEVLGAVMSRVGVEGGGQFKIHWGEVWAHANVNIPNTAFVDVPKDNDPQDPWFAVRAEGIISIGGNHTDGTQKVGYLPNGLSIPLGAQNYYVPYLTDTLHPEIQMSKFGDRENLIQHATDLQWPVYEYDRMKRLCEILGFPIYRTTEEGLIVFDKDLDGNPVDPPVELPFEAAFGNAITPSEINYEEMPPLYFVDTVDGNPPNGNVEDGGNVATVRETGNSCFYYGLFFLAANIYLGGSGDPPQVEAEKPDSSTKVLSKCSVHGLLYTYGTYDQAGERTIYGAVYAESGFGSGGCPEVYYDYRLKHLLRNRLGSAVIPQLWKYGYQRTGDETYTEFRRGDWYAGG